MKQSTTTKHAFYENDAHIQTKIRGCVTLIVCATIVKNDKALLVKHSSDKKPDYGHWVLPAGRVETGEGLEEALKRETKEELGISIKIVRKLIEHVDPYTGDKLINYLCTSPMSEIEISSELAEAKWFNLNEIQKIENIHSSLRQFLIEGLESNSFQE